MIHAIVVFCLVHNPYLCRTLEIVPSDYRAITSVTDCAMGGMIFSTTFTLENMEWRTKGIRCSQDSDIVGEAIAQRFKDR